MDNNDKLFKLKKLKNKDIYFKKKIILIINEASLRLLYFSIKRKEKQK